MEDSIWNKLGTNRYKIYQLIIAFFINFIGIGLASYLGRDIDWLKVFFSISWSILLLTGVYDLKYYFSLLALKQQNKDLIVPPQFANLDKSKFLQSVLLSAIIINISMILINIILVIGSIRPLFSISISFLAIFLGLLYAIPPFRWAETGFGELIESVIICVLIPFYSFQIQSGELHQLIAYFTFPVLLLFISMILIQGLNSFSRDLIKQKKTLVTRINWERSIQFIQIFNIAAIIVLALGSLIGLPVRISISSVFLIPFAGIQIWQMIRILDGQKPKFIQSNLLSISMILLIIYQISFILWMG